MSLVQDNAIVQCLGPLNSSVDNATLPAEVPPPVTVVAPPPIQAPVAEAPCAEGGLDPAAKKIRNLSKKLKAIEELKERVEKGDKLEATQLKKIEGETDIRKELKSLGAPA